MSLATPSRPAKRRCQLEKPGQEIHTRDEAGRTAEKDQQVRDPGGGQCRRCAETAGRPHLPGEHPAVGAV